MDRVILVDKLDQPIGVVEKLRAHLDGGRLHRAFSIFIYNTKGHLLLQRRAAGKYHFAGLWSNTCCSHPKQDEPLLETARRRLRFEFGFDAPLTEVGSFIYKAVDETSDCTEHEYDHVLVGRYDGNPQPNPDEIDAWEWVDVEELRRTIEKQPEAYTPWLRIALQGVLSER